MNLLPSYTNCEFYLSFLNLLKYVGILPVQLEYAPQGVTVTVDDLSTKGATKKRAAIVGVKCITTGKYVWFNRCVLTWLAAYSGFQLVGLIVYWFGDDDELRGARDEFIFVIAWTLNYTIRYCILVQFTWRKAAFCKMLTKWLQLERTILQISKGLPTKTKLQLLRTQTRTCYLVASIYGIYSAFFVVIAAIFGASEWDPFKNRAEVHLKMLHYLVKGSTQITHIYILVLVTFFELLTLLMSQSVAHCLQLLNYGPNSVGRDNKKNDETTMECGEPKEACEKHKASDLDINIKFEKHLALYNDLKEVVADYSSLSAWILFSDKGLSLVLTCLGVYSAVCFTGSNPFLKQSALIFICVSLIQLIRLSFMLIFMGRVQEQAGRFKESWTHGMAINGLTPLNQVKLTMLAVFGYRCGIFYELRPSTVLTYFSILTTYVIVMLQIFNIGKQ